MAPHDASAQRDAARAAQAAGEFEYSVEALERAHHFGAATSAIPSCTTCAARRSTSWAATTRRAASSGSRSWRSASIPTDRM